jgi:hypothetical protein
MKYKAGDTVRIQSQEWIDTQKKDGDGDIHPLVSGNRCFICAMFEYAGKTAKIVAIYSNYYRLDIDNGDWRWQDWMFDPDEPLPAEDAIHAMMDDGETLYDKSGNEYYWDKDDKCFYHRYQDITSLAVVHKFEGLYRRTAKRNRPMTRWEILAWAESEDSLGWMISYGDVGCWTFPRWRNFGAGIGNYQRGRPLPDLSGIDEDTIQGFEIEVEE